MTFDPVAYALAKKKILLTQKKYDANLDNIVDNADAVDGKHASDFAPATHSHTRADITDLLPITRADLEYPTEDVNLAYLAAINKINFDIANGGARAAAIIVVTSDSFTDKAVKCQCADGSGIFGRWIDVNNWYEAVLESTPTTADFRIDVISAGVSTTLASEAVDIGEDERHLLKFSISGSTLTGYRNDMVTAKISATDTTHASGAYGILLGTAGGYHNTDSILALLLAPSSPLPPAQRIIEVDVIGSGTEDDPIRPNFAQLLDKHPNFGDIDKLAVTWGAFDYKGESTMLVTIAEDNPYQSGAILEQESNAKQKNLKVFKPPRDYSEAVEQYRQLRQYFQWIAGKDNYAYQVLGHEVFEHFQVADTYYGRIVEMEDAKAYKDVPDWEMRRTLNMWKERLEKADVLKEEAEKHLNKLKEVERKGW